jgi:hypothetical protein
MGGMPDICGIAMDMATWVRGWRGTARGGEIGREFMRPAGPTGMAISVLPPLANFCTGILLPLLAGFW